MDNISYGDFVFCGLYDFFGSVFSKRTAKLDAAHAVDGEFFRRCAGFFEIGYADDLRRFAMNGCRILGIYKFAQDEIRKFHFDPPFFVNGIKGEACQSSSCSIAVI